MKLLVGFFSYEDRCLLGFFETFSWVFHMKMFFRSNSFNINVFAGNRAYEEKIAEN